MIESDLQELDLLLERLCEGFLEEEQHAVNRLIKLVDESETCRHRYLDTLELHAALWRTGGDGLPLSEVSAAGSQSGFAALGFLSTALHGMIGYFSEGMPLAYLLATVVTGLGLLIGLLIHVSRPEQVAHNSLPAVVVEPKAELVGRITGMVDCKWAREGTGDRGQRPGTENRKVLVSLGQKFFLASGLMEITYDTGAKVILQGLVTYEADSNGGYLSVGKLTGKLEKKNDECKMMNDELRTHVSDIHPSSFILHPFSIRTPTATVTDLGTEFGVEVGQDGASEVHVLAGQVDLVPQSGPNHVRLIANSENSAVRVGAGARDIVKLHSVSSRFVRAMPTPPARDDVAVEWSGMLPEGSLKVAGNDLLQTSLAMASTNFDPRDGFPDQTLSVLYDGKFYPPDPHKLVGDMFPTLEGTFAFPDGKGVTFVLDTRVNKLGYSIDSIDVYTGHNCGRVAQNYKVEFAQVGQDGWLSSPVVKFAHEALWDQSLTNLWEARSHIHVLRAGTPLATGINRIRFTFYKMSNPLQREMLVEGLYREIDVFGSPTKPTAQTDEGRK